MSTAGSPAARVLSHDQRSELIRQAELFESLCRELLLRIAAYGAMLVGECDAARS